MAYRLTFDKADAVCRSMAVARRDCTPCAPGLHNLCLMGKAFVVVPMNVAHSLKSGLKRTVTLTISERVP
jgi:hypothetical protein